MAYIHRGGDVRDVNQAGSQVGVQHQESVSERGSTRVC